ncbi:hypothetical protein RhiirC2_787868 [Rhizophagus irregularis]|uniref:Uncharacterized protein n=1 Tax=Rhizophagus irregularis TaxID=588596 RepID=A0A2N1MRC0_9GLOM|nr:hypothetical protein RhiirC2_787868 [Rhizophagus irregularis]
MRSQIDESFQLLLQKCGGYFENFGCYFGVQNELLFESIIKYCKNIKTLDLDWKNNIECSSIVLQNLGKILPFKLEYLDLCLHIKMSDFEIMKKKRVKYLATRNSENYEELVLYKDEVEEFKLYDIKVQSYESSTEWYIKYNCLYIYHSERKFTNETYL